MKEHTDEKIFQWATELAENPGTIRSMAQIQQSPFMVVPEFKNERTQRLLELDQTDMSLYPDPGFQTENKPYQPIKFKKYDLTQVKLKDLQADRIIDEIIAVINTQYDHYQLQQAKKAILAH